MATVTVAKALNGYFNTGDGKRTAKEFLEELKEFTPEEKLDLAREVTKITGDELVASVN